MERLPPLPQASNNAWYQKCLFCLSYNVFNVPSTHLPQTHIIAYIVPVCQAMLIFSITNNTKRRGTRLRQKNTIEKQHS